MKYFLIAGEASGDMHGSYLLQAIKEVDANAVFAYWGGDMMKNVAAGLLHHYKETSFMGIVEVVKNIGRVIDNFKKCKQHISNFKPDIVIFIDYPGFNLKMAAYAKRQGYKTIYYIAPKVWAWRESRVKKLEKYIDHLILIFPFEPNYFKQWNLKFTYVGNPMAEAILNYRPDVNFLQNHQLNNKNIVALLPGSRRQEISKTLPVMLRVAAKFKTTQFVVAGAPGIEEDFYNKFNVGQNNIKIVYNNTYNLLAYAKAALVCSGTATLETALFNVPQVCGYIANGISVFIAKLLVKVKYVSLVNLCLNKFAIKEFIQQDFNDNNLHHQLNLLLSDSNELKNLYDDYLTLRNMYNNHHAAKEAANIIINVAAATKV